MKEQILKDYFESKVPADTLVADLKGSRQRTGYDTITFHVTPLNEENRYEVTRKHLLKLCNDTISAQLSPTDLNTIAFILISSDFFTWDSDTQEGEIVSTTVFDWDNPDMNFDLTIENLKLWREYLETGKYNLKSKDGN